MNWKKLALCLSALTVCAAIRAAGATYRIEPEYFPDLESWTEDISTNTSGKCSLLSNKHAGNVLAAEFVIPEAGPYHLWIRTYDYGEGLRTTTVKINGQSIGTFGDNPLKAGAKVNFYWHKSAQPVELAAGPMNLELLPHTDYSRIDAILLTTDAEFVPPNTKKEIQAARFLMAMEPIPSTIAPLPQGEQITVRIEPEKIANRNQWQLDPMGKASGGSMLRAEKTKNNAIHETFSVGTPYRYFVWVRNFSYGAGGRRFAIEINGKKLGLFGDNPLPAGKKAPDLCWEMAKIPVILTGQEMILTLVPDSPYARVDAIILSTDPNFVPSDNSREIEQIPLMK